MIQTFYSVIPASVLHIKPISKKLRPASCLTLQSFGDDVRSGLMRAFRSSIYCRTATVSGVPIAMWGAYGVSLSDHAIAWLALTNDIVHYPFAIVRCARKELETMKEKAGTLYATIGLDDPKAKVFAETLGFSHYEDVPDMPGISGNMEIMRLREK